MRRNYPISNKNPDSPKLASGSDHALEDDFQDDIYDAQIHLDSGKKIKKIPLKNVLSMNHCLPKMAVLFLEERSTEQGSVL